MPATVALPAASTDEGVAVVYARSAEYSLAE